MDNNNGDELNSKSPNELKDLDKQRGKTASDQAINTAASAYLRANGVPKPLADAAAKKVNQKLDRNSLGKIGKNALANKMSKMDDNTIDKLNKASQVAGANAGNKQKNSNSNNSLKSNSKSSETDDSNKNNDVKITADNQFLKFIKKHPGLVASVGVGLLYACIIFIVLFFVLAGIMYILESVGGVFNGIQAFLQDAGERWVNLFTGSGFNNDEQTYSNNVDIQTSIYVNEKNTDLEGRNIDDMKSMVKYYLNGATYFEYNGANIDPSSVNESENDNSSVSESAASALIKLQGQIKDDPTKLIPAMFQCYKYNGGTKTEETCEAPSNETEKYVFDEIKYKKYLQETYSAEKFKDYEEKDITEFDENKQSQIKNEIAEEMISRAREAYINANTGDSSNYQIYSVLTSGITIEDEETKEIIGTFSFQDCIGMLVQRDVSAYSKEIQKAYALTMISKTLMSGSVSTVTESGLKDIKVSDEVKASVKEVIDLKISSNEKVYYEQFDFEAATNTLIKNPNATYEDILKDQYDAEIEFTKSVSNGLQLDPTTGFYTRVSAPDKNDASYYGVLIDGKRSGTDGLVGECAWYATNRAQEITQTLGVTEWTGNSNGNGFCYLASASNYETCWPSKGQKCSPRQGAMISWGYSSGDYSNYGHVGIIEKVEGNNVLLSDSALSRGKYSYLGTYSAITDHLSGISDGRYKNCTDDISKSCIRVAKNSISSLSTGNNGRYIICYIYLTNPK